MILSGTDLKREILWRCHVAQDDYAAIKVESRRVAHDLEQIVSALRQHPELITTTPMIGNPDYRKALEAVNRESILEIGRKCAEAKKALREADKNAQALRLGRPQTNLDNFDSDEENDIE